MPPGLEVSAEDARLWLRGLRPIDLRVANTERGQRAWFSEVSVHRPDPDDA